MSYLRIYMFAHRHLIDLRMLIYFQSLSLDIRMRIHILGLLDMDAHLHTNQNVYDQLRTCLLLR